MRTRYGQARHSARGGVGDAPESDGDRLGQGADDTTAILLCPTRYTLSRAQRAGPFDGRSQDLVGAVDDDLAEELGQCRDQRLGRG